MIKTRIRQLLASDSVSLIIALIILIGFFATQSDYFFSATTFTTLANQMPALLVISVGMTFVLIIAGIDLSVGSVMALCGAVLGLAVVVGNLPLWLAAVLCLAAGLSCGFLNGLTVTTWGVPSFIVTLGMLEIARGGAYLLTGSKTLYIGSQVEFISTPIAGINLSPAWFVAIAVVIIGQLILSKTVFGRYVIAVGSNEEAVRLSGIRLNRDRKSVV